MKKTTFFIIICTIILFACSTQRTDRSITASFSVAAEENQSHSTNQTTTALQENKIRSVELAPECIQTIYKTNIKLTTGIILSNRNVNKTGNCGGVAISEHLVVTAFHVLEEGEVIFIEENGYVAGAGKIIKCDPLKRYALLEFPDVDFKTFAVPTTKMSYIGQKLYTIASDSYILDFFTEFTVGKINNDGIIRVKPANIPGNSGFGIYDYNCELVGIIDSYTKINEIPVSGNIVPVSYFKEVFDYIYKNADNNTK